MARHVMLDMNGTAFGAAAEAVAMWLAKFSVTRLGDLWALLLTKCLTTVAQMDEDSLGFFENIDFQVKSVVATLGQLF